MTKPEQKRLLICVTIILVLMLASCDTGNGTDPDGDTPIIINRFNSVAEASAYLTAQIVTGLYASDPVFLPMNINLGNMGTGSGWYELLNAINSAGRYVSLDLETCPMSDTIFGYSLSNNRIVSIVLPMVSTSIRANAFSGCTALKSVSFPAVTDIGSYAT